MNREGDNQLNDESLTPLMSRRRSAWSTSSGTGLDIEEGCGPTPGSGCASVDEAPGDSISVRVKTSGDEKVYQVSTPLSATVAQLKAEVSRVIDAEGKYLRLISSGKMLNPNESLVKDFGLSENCYVHCVVTATPPRLRLPSLTPEQTIEEGEDDDQGELRGFDELRNNGMTRAEVAAIRSYFSADVQGFSRTLPDTPVEGQTDWDRQVSAEEAWMRAQSPTSEFALNVRLARRGSSPMPRESRPSGDTRDFMFGLAMGSLFGFIMLLWVWEMAVPPRQKLGILVGVILKLTMNMIRDAVGKGDGEDG